MRLTLLMFLCTICLSTGFAQNGAENEQWIRENYIKIERSIPMRDGAKLFTAIYHPKDMSVKHPMLMMRTPYSISPYGENKITTRLTEFYYMKYLRLGYIFIFQDVRGKYMSEGEYMDIRPFNPNKKGKDTDEASDAYDAIDWLVKNVPANNGRIGVLGISYPGFYATMAAMSGHPALKAVSPQAPVTEWFLGDDFHHNGAFSLLDAFNFYTFFGKPRPRPDTISSKSFVLPVPDNYQFYLRTGALKNFTKLTGDSIKFWKEMMDHPNYDAWWKARDPRNFADKVQPATLVVGGLFDAEDCYGGWALYKAIEKKSKNNNKLVYGPWYHGGWARSDGDSLGNVKFKEKTSLLYRDSIEIPFFNYYLLDKGNANSIPEASIFFSGENKWKKFASWPPADAKTKNLYLLSNGKMSFDSQGIVSGKPSPGFTEYMSDPTKPVPYTEDVHLARTRQYMTDDQRFAARRPDVLVFELPELIEDIKVAGPVIADLKVSINTTDADFVVKLIDVFPENFTYDSSYGPQNGAAYPMGGYQMLVRGEIMRGKFRNSFEKPIPFQPGVSTTVKFALPDIAHTFRKGHKIMIQIQSTWFPLMDRNPQKFMDIYQANDSDFQKANIRIHHDVANPSKILLPLIN